MYLQTTHRFSGLANGRQSSGLVFFRVNNVCCLKEHRQQAVQAGERLAHPPRHLCCTTPSQYLLYMCTYDSAVDSLCRGVELIRGEAKETNGNADRVLMVMVIVVRVGVRSGSMMKYGKTCEPHARARLATSACAPYPRERKKRHQTYRVAHGYSRPVVVL